MAEPGWLPQLLQGFRSVSIGHGGLQGSRPTEKNARVLLPPSAGLLLPLRPPRLCHCQSTSFLPLPAYSSSSSCHCQPTSFSQRRSSSFLPLPAYSSSSSWLYHLVLLSLPPHVSSPACPREARLIVITQDGEHSELTANVTQTRLYENLGANSRFMGFYDVKNAKLAERRGLYLRREPGMDEIRFKIFLSMMENIAKPGEDFLWILAGSSEVAAKKIATALTQKGAQWKYKTYFFVYDRSQLGKYYWTRMRGLANSKTTEKAFLCWKGPTPKNMPNERQYVDAGSGLSVDTMLKVPVLAPKDLTFVDKEVRETSMKSMGGVADVAASAAGDMEEAMEPVAASAAEEGAAEPALVQHVKKRRLYRHTTGEELEWFPLDNAPDLLRELVWECGGHNVRWVLHGTPASGAGVIGCLEMGCSLVCLCDDAHHKEHFEKALKERAVERMLAGSRVFKSESLAARALELLPGTAKAEEKDQAKKKEAKEEDKKEDKKEAKKKDEKDGKDTKKKAVKGGKKKKKSTKKEAKDKKDGKSKAESKKRKRGEEEEPEEDEDDEEDGESGSEEDDDEEE